jgi:predicted DsbA family dithiol-disulfide isomerase
MKIEFVSDVACPWCAVGLASLERALEKLGETVYRIGWIVEAGEGARVVYR